MIRLPGDRTARRFRACGFVMLLALLLLPLLGTPTRAADPPFAVNSLLDQPDSALGDGVCAAAPSGHCTLRAAVQEGQASNRAVSVPVGLYELTQGQLVVTQNLTLTGAGSGLTRIDGALQTRVFDIAAGGFAYIGDVTVQWGKAGQSAVVPSHYHGGAIHNHGTLVLVNSTVRASSSSIPGWGGGGITNAGGATATLQNVTLTGNSTTMNGGGIENSGTLNVYSSTIVGNQAFGSPTSGGGVYGAVATTRLKNTLVANNFDGGNCGGTIADGGFNLESAATCGFPAARSNKNPLLGARDSRDIYPLQPASPAVDSGTNLDCPTTDQRGGPRPQDGNNNGIAVCDVGADELQPPDLRISFMSDSPDPVQPGAGLIYTIDVLNPGPSTLTDLQLVDTLPADVVYSNYAETRGGTCSHAAGIVTCDLASLDGNRVWTVYLYTTVKPDAAGSLLNTVTVTSDATDPNTSNNSDSETTAVTALPSVVFGAATARVGESAGSASISVRLSAASQQQVTVQYATSNGSATAPDDYTATSGTLVFGAGQTAGTISVPIVADTLAEGNETLHLALSAPNGATLGAPAAVTLTLADDDSAAAPQWSAYLPAVRR